MTIEGSRSHIEAARRRLRDTGLPGAADFPTEPRCAAIVAANPASRAVALKAAGAAMADGGVASVRVGNPLSSPLALRRILIQVDLDGGGDDADVDDEARLVRLLEERRGALDRVALVVEQAETLDLDALLSLQRIATAPGATWVLFVGTPAFWTLLEPPGLDPLRRALTGRGAEPAAMAAHAPATPPSAAPAQPPAAAIPDRPASPLAGPQPEAPARSGLRWWIIGATGLAVTIVAGVASVLAPGGLFYYAVPQRDMPAPPGGAAGSQATTPARPSNALARPPTPQPPPAPPPAARAEAQQARPQPEPAQPPDAPGRDGGASAAAQSGQSPIGRPRDAASPTAPSSSEGRIVIHYRGGSGTGEADRLAAAAAPLAARVQTRAVAETPSAPVVRFFHPEDGALARRLADVLGGPGSGWEVKDFGSFRPRPSPGTVEVWTPAR